MIGRRLSRLVACLAVVAALATFVVVAAPQAVSAIDYLRDACKGAGASSAACSGKDTITGSGGIILRAAELLSIVAGIVGVIVIMFAGFAFITAGGDSGKITTAKQTITYTVVGLVVIFLARAIVIFVVNAV